MITFFELSYIEKRTLVESLNTDRDKLILNKPKAKKTKARKKTVKKQTREIRFASPELEKAFNLMGEDCKKFILGLK